MKEKTINYQINIPCIKSAIKQLQKELGILGEYKRHFKRRRLKCSRCKVRTMVYRVNTNDLKCRNCGFNSDIDNF